MNDPMTTLVSPQGALELLSRREMESLGDRNDGRLNALLRRCALAVLNCGSNTDDTRQIFNAFKSFEIRLVQQDRGPCLELRNAPSQAFIQGKLIQGIKEHLFSVFRDIAFAAFQFTLEINGSREQDQKQITESVFNILRNARVLNSRQRPNLAVFWGGHAISRDEYEYTQKVGYEMGLQGLDICTGCGPGAMKGPMKGALVGHFKQRILNGKYLGLTEPSIIAAEPPNPIVSGLVILPDIEKRLEAFVRMAHGLVVFPGGPGTMEEILYILSILLHPENKEAGIPLIFTGPEKSRPYFQMIHDFIGTTLGFEAQQKYEIIINDPGRVARMVRQGTDQVALARKATGDAFFFNWQLTIPDLLTRPFVPNHHAMSNLQLTRDIEPGHLAANLRQAFSGIVAGNIKQEGIEAIETHGPFELRGDAQIMKGLDTLLSKFVAQHRMKLPGSTYEPCYRIIKGEKQ